MARYLNGKGNAETVVDSDNRDYIESLARNGRRWLVAQAAVVERDWANGDVSAYLAMLRMATLRAAWRLAQ